jgi:hypothetical protein
MPVPFEPDLKDGEALQAQTPSGRANVARGALWCRRLVTSAWIPTGPPVRGMQMLQVLCELDLVAVLQGSSIWIAVDATKADLLDRCCTGQVDGGPGTAAEVSRIVSSWRDGRPAAATQASASPRFQSSAHCLHACISMHLTACMHACVRAPLRTRLPQERPRPRQQHRARHPTKRQEQQHSPRLPSGSALKKASSSNTSSTASWS